MTSLARVRIFDLLTLDEATETELCHQLDAYRAEVLAEHARDETDALAEAPDFFVPGRTYAREHHASTIRFLVRYIDESPDGIGYRVAFGWRTEDGDFCSSPFDSDDFTGWTDVTEGGAK